MYIRAVSLVMALMLIPIVGAHAGLELSFSDTTPPAPLTDAVLPVDGAFTIDVIAKAPAGTIAAVDFAATWTPSGNVEYLGVTKGNFLPGALIIEVDSGTTGTQSLAVTTSGSAWVSRYSRVGSLNFTSPFSSVRAVCRRSPAN